MGIKSCNFAKNIGSAVFAGGGGMIAKTAAGPIFQSAASVLMEGGEITVEQQVRVLKKKYSASLKSPITPTINAIIGMLYIKILMGGIVNS